MWVLHVDSKGQEPYGLMPHHCICFCNVSDLLCLIAAYHTLLQTVIIKYAKFIQIHQKCNNWLQAMLAQFCCPLPTEASSHSQNEALSEHGVPARLLTELEQCLPHTLLWPAHCGSLILQWNLSYVYSRHLRQNMWEFPLCAILYS